MDDRPSFRKRKDVLQLLGAVALPWVIVAIAYAPGLIFRELHRAGWAVGSPVSDVARWWWLVGIMLMMLVPVSLSLFGVWRLVWRRAYRRSLFGWLWPPLVFFNMGLVGGAIGF